MDKIMEFWGKSQTYVIMDHENLKDMDDVEELMLRTKTLGHAFLEMSSSRAYENTWDTQGWKETLVEVPHTWLKKSPKDLEACST